MLVHTQQPQVGFPEFPQKLIGKIIHVSEVNERHWLEESGLWLENVDNAHLVLASRKQGH